MTRPHLSAPPYRLGALLLAPIMGLLTLNAPAAAGAPASAATVVLPSQSDGGENDFLPPDRDLTECVSALPKPGCGSEARGGWRQTAVFLAVLGGLGFIAWRVIAGTCHPTNQHDQHSA